MSTFTYITNAAISHTWSCMTFYFLFAELIPFIFGIWFGNREKDWWLFWRKYTSSFYKEVGNQEGHSFISDVSGEKAAEEPDLRAQGGASPCHVV